MEPHASLWSTGRVWSQQTSPCTESARRDHRTIAAGAAATTKCIFFSDQNLITLFIAIIIMSVDSRLLAWPSSVAVHPLAASPCQRRVMEWEGRHATGGCGPRIHDSHSPSFSVCLCASSSFPFFTRSRINWIKLIEFEPLIEFPDSHTLDSGRRVAEAAGRLVATRAQVSGRSRRAPNCVTQPVTRCS